VAGLVFPNFESGDVLYVTGTTKILIGPVAAELLPRSNLVVKIKVVEAIYVQKGLPFRGTAGEYSPYNPDVRLLAKEGSLGGSLKPSASNTAKLIRKTQITPDIYRFRFAMSRLESYRAGQWAALDFSGELDMGYSHMRDDDPLSLNDDFTRTFTISSHPDNLAPGEFEMTIRSVGTVTGFLCRQNERSGLEVPLRGISGDFVVKSDGTGPIPFVAGGIGITPLLAQLSDLPMDRLRLFWSLRSDALDLALDTLDANPGLGQRSTLFLTGRVTQEINEKLKTLDVRIQRRRMEAEDVKTTQAETWYMCAGPIMQETLLGWLEDQTVVSESFNY
jgi:ferredoxin-NADP reductase